MTQAWNNYTVEQIEEICRRLGALLKVPANLDGGLTLFALAGQESAYGKNCKPRFEPAYYNGKYSTAKQMQELIGLYGEDAAKSYGPWQVMLCNAPGFTPAELATDLEKSLVAAIGFINRVILGAQKAEMLEHIADAFNSGNWRDANKPASYIAHVRANYDKGYASSWMRGVKL